MSPQEAAVIREAVELRRLVAEQKQKPMAQRRMVWEQARPLFEAVDALREDWDDSYR